MLRNYRPAKISHLTLAAAFMIGSSLAMAEPGQQGGNRSLAGQMCPSGSFVIGFDAAGDIVCSQGCTTDCRPEAAQRAEAAANPAVAAAASAPAAATAPAAVVAPATAVAAAPAVSATATGPVIAEIAPSSVLYGTRELAMTIVGTGFNAGSVIEFAGRTYTPSVNQEGTRLEATVATRNLAMGRYAVTVSNGPGQKSTLGKALVVY